MEQVEILINGLVLFFASVGLVVGFSIAFRVMLSLYRALSRKPYALTKRYGNGWAVVTGATDGIGKASAYQLAKRGLNVLLVSRTESKLQETQKELQTKFPNVQISYLQMDFGAFDKAKTQKALEGLEGGVAILINNVGVSYDFPMLFHEMKDDRVSDMIRLNIDSTTEMTRLVLPLMKDRKGGLRRGAIVNIGSAAGLNTNPLLTQYSAAKAYVKTFSEGLAVEYAPLGIDVQVHVPFFVVSKLSKFRKPSIFVPSAEAYAKMICDRIGYEAVVNPYLPHAFIGYLLPRIPAVLRDSFIRSHHMGIRSKGMKKLAGGEKTKNT